MNQQKRRKTPTVQIGNILIGCRHPVVIQSMTDTPTADIDATLTQTIELVKAGSQLVRWTINDDKAAQAVPEIIKRLRQKGYATPIIGDFHFNGHQLLTKHPEMAKAL
ncbi:MAG: flavodoxin-dependent (E)-4-hydroxy-3-methylbut-2-enyl-diphosphate synthase, partial [Candidatus Omnitrophica bacterium]|nr:flavodoxin-dependent (E)-4-hydroxy-3-methylbut-2-enyl-diphosphate synthase [Candidatus Omnitrophota bacterium]